MEPETTKLTHSPSNSSFVSPLSLSLPLCLCLISIFSPYLSHTSFCLFTPASLRFCLLRLCLNFALLLLLHFFLLSVPATASLSPFAGYDGMLPVAPRSALTKRRRLWGIYS